MSPRRCASVPSDPGRHRLLPIAETSEVDHPQTALLRQVPSVGSVNALCYVLTLEDPD